MDRYPNGAAAVLKAISILGGTAGLCQDKDLDEISRPRKSVSLPPSTTSSSPRRTVAAVVANETRTSQGGIRVLSSHYGHYRTTALQQDGGMVPSGERTGLLHQELRMESLGLTDLRSRSGRLQLVILRCFGAGDATRTPRRPAWENAPASFASFLLHAPLETAPETRR